MEADFSVFFSLFKRNKITVQNKYLESILYKFDFLLYSNIDILKTKYQDNTAIIIIDEYKDKHHKKYYFICYDYKLIIFLPNSESDLSAFISFLDNTNSRKYFFKNSSTLAHYSKNINNIFLLEIERFSSQFFIENEECQHIWSLIVPCICGFLIKAGYKNSKVNHYKFSKEEFKEHQEKVDPRNKSFVELRYLGKGSAGSVSLIYYFPKQMVFALKAANDCQYELIERERENYLNLQFPLFVRYYGYFLIDEKKCLLLEFVQGQTLNEIDLNALSISTKVFIVFELMLSVHFIHSKNYICRDLNPNNIIINKNKDAILIDFDRVIQADKQTTMDFIRDCMPPENVLTSKSDIYSLGYIAYYIFFNEKPIKKETENQADDINIIFNQNSIEGIKDFGLDICFRIDPNKRPNISELIYQFIMTCLSNQGRKREKMLIKLFVYNSSISNYLLDLFTLAKIYLKGIWVDKDAKQGINYLTIAADENYLCAQYLLASLYSSGYETEPNIEKAVHYYTLAANQNYSDAQYYLGALYRKDDAFHDIQKSIFYLELAAEQNHKKAQFLLGLTYYEGKYIEADMEKAIYYFSLSANQNYAKAHFHLGLIYHSHYHVISKAIYHFSFCESQKFTSALFFLGNIYYEGDDVQVDKDKGLYYLTKAANFNNINAQSQLGYIYSRKNEPFYDINKAIKYLSLGASQGNSLAQRFLGKIYYSGENIEKNYTKANYYFMQAANQDDPESLFYLGVMNFNGEGVQRDTEKAIQYLKHSANLGCNFAQYTLGKLYYNGPLELKDINNAKYYLTLAAEQNLTRAQFLLGSIYYEEIDLKDINLAIHYFTQAANKNCSSSQFYLGLIYFKGLEVPQDIRKSIFYLTLSANKGNAMAQSLLGGIYCDGIYVPRDINKAIAYLTPSANNSKVSNILGSLYYELNDINKSLHYFTLSAKQMDSDAQKKLGLIYYQAIYVPRDIYKSIYYFKLSADQNNAESQAYLGMIYIEGKYIAQDVNKGIYYLTLSANQNCPISLLSLGEMYYFGICVERDMAKAIYYLEMAAKYNEESAYDILGEIYYIGISVKKDINKAIYYYTLGANKNSSSSQCKLGILYSYDDLKIRDIKKAIFYLSLSAKQYNSMANHYLGCIYYEGLGVKQDVEKAIHYFKEASSFNSFLSKNNLGVIYKTGDYVKQNIGGAIEYFKEAIRENDDGVARYNLANIYLYDENDIHCIDNVFQLLIQAEIAMIEGIIILALAVIKRYSISSLKVNWSIILNDFTKIDRKRGEGWLNNVIKIIKKRKLYLPELYEKYYFYFKHVNYFYFGDKPLFDLVFLGYKSDDLNYCINNPQNVKKLIKSKEVKKNDSRIPINSHFYEGLGDIYTK